MHRKIELLIVILVISSFGALYTFASTKTQPKTENYETATFAGGCFWCMEQVMDNTEGVVSTKVGYTGGEEENPTYKEVSSGQTGHAEAIQVQFDPKVIPYSQLLEVFWHNIDPTVKDRQFCDVGSQYRSAIYYHNPQQQELAEKTKQELIDSGKFDQVFTEIEEASRFYEAEKYHQSYYKKNPIRYKLYKYLCGREKRLHELWGEETKS